MADCSQDQVSGRKDEPFKNCMPCLGKGMEKSASKYCYDCKTSICSDCTELHNLLFTKHRLSDSGSVDVPDQCQQHGKVKELYCEEDDIPVCDECIVSEHRTCKKIVHLPKLAQGVIEETDIGEIKTKLRETFRQLESIELAQQTSLSDIETDRDKCLQKINEHHKEVSALLDKIVDSSKDKVQKTYERLRNKLHDDQQKVKQCLTDLETTDQQIDNKQDNAVRLFLEIKEHKQQVELIEDVIIKSLKTLKVTGFSVTLDQRCYTLLKGQDTLATVLLKVVPFNVKTRNVVDISVDGEEEVSHVWGSCVLPDGSIILADFNNTKLKRLDQQKEEPLKIVDNCTVRDKPRDVCCIDGGEVAVSLENNTITIMSVYPRMSTIRTIQIDHNCAFLAHSQGTLLVNDQSKSLYIYDIEGTLLRKITTDRLGKEIFSCLRHISVSDRREMYVTDIDKGMLTLDEQGTVLDVFMGDGLMEAINSISLDGAGGLFTSGFHSNNVIHVELDGKNISEILTESHGLINPRSVCYDRDRLRLFVSQNESNQLHIVDFE